MQDAMREIAAEVRGIAAKNRATQAQIATILGVERKAAGARLNGNVPFSAAELLLLARAWNEPISSFFPKTTPVAA